MRYFCTKQLFLSSVHNSCRPVVVPKHLKTPVAGNKGHECQVRCCSVNDSQKRLTGGHPSTERIVPYLKLMRLDKPTGALLLLWPSYWSIALATPAASFPDLYILGLFGAGAVLMRGAGCTINDMWDREYDAKVKRTKDRPLASGRIKMFPATVFLGTQLSTALFILTRFDISSIILGASSMFLVVTYPLSKRYTHWAQLVLGLTFNWGALLGWSVVTQGNMMYQAVIPLYLSGVLWTLIYDTIYAHQDKSDDLMVGLKSTAIKFGDRTKLWLSLFSGGMICSLMVAGVTTQQLWPFYTSVGIIGCHLTNQLWTLNINDPDDCWKKFKQNSQIGWILFSGIVLSTLLKKDGKTSNDGNDTSDDRKVE